jgi:hypothetical protein
MVVFKREVRLWRETNAVHRALLLRDDADSAWVAVELQHDRIVSVASTEPNGNVRLSLLRRKIDVDFFFMALHRLVVTAELVQEVADPRQVMPGALAMFNQKTAGMMLSQADEPATIANIRNALEHGQNLERRGGLGFGTGPDGWYVSYRDRMVETRQLLEAACELHRSVREAIDPEAFADFHGQYPFVELRDPTELSPRQRLLGANRVNEPR